MKLNWMKTSIEYNKLKTQLQEIKQQYKVTMPRHLNKGNGKIKTGNNTLK